jgi:hypothetical protein
MSDTSLLILAREFRKLRDDTRSVLEMPVGPQGEQGEKGERGEQGLTGRDGVDGRDGRDGQDGKNGRDGATGPKGDKGDPGALGKDGPQGVSVVDAEVDFDNRLRLTLSTGKILDAGEIIVEKGNNAVHVAGNAWQITVSSTAPANPQLNQLWLDIS